MNKIILAIICAAGLVTAHAQEATQPVKEMPANVPGFTQETVVSWYDIDPGVRKYFILLTANSMAATAELPDGGVNPTPEQEFDMMQKVMDETPTDSLKGEYLAYVQESNAINRRIVADLKAERPTDIQGVMAVTSRYDGELSALCAKYPEAGKYFAKEAAIGMSIMLMRETEIQRVAMQAAMAGKSPKECMQTVVEHLRRVAEDQQ
ncbi:MAG: hypothetical protein IKZ13_02220 [Akkermansia sp.]|nr:hypothetical protein [Akkermansia sp.]